MDLAALIAFAGLMAGQFAAVVAVHATRQDGAAPMPTPDPLPPAGVRPAASAR
jgi:hypothetical protein